MLVAIVVGLVGALVVGALNGYLVARDRIQPIVVTLATLIAGRGLAQVLSDDGAARADPRRGVLRARPRSRGTGAGAGDRRRDRRWRSPRSRCTPCRSGATCSRPAATPRRRGWPACRCKRTLITVYALSGLLAGVAGLLEASRLGASDAAKIGLNIELDAIAAIVVGGTALVGGRATILGTVVGALVMQVIATSFNMLLIPYAWSLALKAVIILAAVFAQRPKRV